MRPLLQFTVVLLASSVLLPGCSLMGAGEPSKPLHFYTIGPVPEQEDASDSDPSEQTVKGEPLIVSQFDGSGIYTETPIVWKNQQHLQRFKYNRWANPPTRMLQDVMVQLLRRESSGDGLLVQSGTSDIEHGRFQVLGDLRTLYLKRLDEAWEVVLDLELTLVRRASDQTLTGRSFSSDDIVGSWSLNATGQVDAPDNEQETPSAMNKMLSDLNGNLSDRGGKIARSIIKRVQAGPDRTNEQEENNSDGTSDGK